MDNNETRPDLKPADPRGKNSATNDFDICGSIDNANTFNAETGKSTPHPHGTGKL